MRVLFAGLSRQGRRRRSSQQLDAAEDPLQVQRRRLASWCRPTKSTTLKLKLAQAGLPKSSVMGNEIFDANHFGQTQTQERMNLQRAREGELTRTIEPHRRGANPPRVHLRAAEPERLLPRAGEGERLRDADAARRAPRSIARRSRASCTCVSSSVPDPQPEGRRRPRPDRRAPCCTAVRRPQRARASTPHAAAVRAARSSRATPSASMDLLEPVVGRDNLRATVTADVDFSQSEATSEQFKPNQGDARRRRCAASRPGDSTQGGAQPRRPASPRGRQQPAASSPATAPINGASAPLQARADRRRRERRAAATASTVTNYEVDTHRCVFHSTRTGAIRRLNAAVIVNHRVSTDAKGKSDLDAAVARRSSTSSPRSCRKPSATPRTAAIPSR